MANDQPKPPPKDKSHDAPLVQNIKAARDAQAINRMADKSGNAKPKESIEGKKTDGGENATDKSLTPADKRSAKKNVDRLGQTHTAEGSDKVKPVSDKATDEKRNKDSSAKTKSETASQPGDHLQSHDYTDPVAKLEQAGEHLNKRIDLLNHLKEQYSNFIEDTKKGVDAEFESVKSRGETIDNVATVATIAVNLGGIASKGADAMKLSGEALAKVNQELVHDARDLALDPIKDAGKERLSKLADSKLNEGFGKAIVDLALNYGKPSYWAQLFTGKISDAHKSAIEKLDRSRAETNDKYDAEIYATRQQLLEVNARRDEINSSRGNR